MSLFPDPVVLPWFRDLDGKRKRLIADDDAGSPPKEEGFIGKPFLGFEVGKWTDKDVVEACRSTPNPTHEGHKNVEMDDDDSDESTKSSVKSVKDPAKNTDEHSSHT